MYVRTSAFRATSSQKNNNLDRVAFWICHYLAYCCPAMNYAAAFPSSSDHEGNSSSSEDSEVDETLIRELRESLHFCVGKICRAEELAAAKEKDGDNDDDDDSDDGMSTTSATAQKTDTVMSKEAIAALTELVYHYSTSSLANDLNAFSNHANRRTVKADDVLLVARKEKHILSELKRKLAASQPAAVVQSSNKGGNSTTKTTAAAGRRNKKNTNKNSNNTRKSPNNPLFNSAKKKTTTKSKSMLLDSSSSSSSSSSSDSDVDPVERIRKRRLELKQKNLNKTAFDQSARNNNNDDDSSDSSSSSSDGLGLTLGKSKTNISKYKKQARSNKPNNRTVDKEDDMVIDLQDSD